MKKIVTPSAVAKHVAFTLTAGQHPVEDAVSAAGAMKLRGWQKDGYKALRGHPLRILLAPTGSGKSTLIKALAWDDLDSDPKARVVIAVPQTLIGDSFDAVDLLIDRRLARWSVDRRLLSGAGSVEALVAFVRDGAKDGRSLVCTHATLVRAHQILMAGAKETPSPWAGVSLFIDEAHHSTAVDLDPEVDVPLEQQEAALRNQLGRVVAHWLERAPGPLLLATATWMRSDLMGIIPKSRRDDFTRFVHTMEAHLEAMQHLREVSFRFLIGNPLETLRAIYAEGNKKTIAYLPQVNTPYMQAAGGKEKVLESYQKAIGKEVARDAWTTTVQHLPKGGKPLRVRMLDFVSLEGRDERKDTLRAGIRAGGGKATPDLLWALNLGKEGFDWAELERAIVIGERGSPVDVLQMMGRILRDYPGKARVEFNMVLPYEGKGAADVEQVRNYIKTILASMVVEWPLRLPKIGAAGSKAEDDAAKRVLEKLASDPQIAAGIVGRVSDAVLKRGDAAADEEAIIGAAVDAEVELDKEERKAAIAQVKALFSERTRALIRDSADLPFAVDLQQSAFGCVRVLAARFGYSTLGELKAALWPGRITATLEECVTFGESLPRRRYNLSRREGMPSSGEFPKIFGLTYQEAMKGARRSRVSASLEHVQKFGSGLTREEYDERKLPGMPASAAFRQAYGVTFNEAMYGTGRTMRVRRAANATLDDVRAFAKGMTIEHYNASRLPGMPISTAFPRIFGFTFREAIDGKRGHFASTATLDDVRSFAEGMTQQQYHAARLPGMPRSSSFPKLFGMTFKEAITGKVKKKRVAITATVEEVRSFARDMTQKRYDLERLAGMPHSSFFRQFYGITYATFRDGPP